ncbi:hypothetical protein PUN28_001981 [Cardiocondyla obscurior]|uniref:Uncharacterized protein n=1 Tax=Cardiocondyla obscurior TaxID=286306 RepID=A0AAW2GS80_9HYME
MYVHTYSYMYISYNFLFVDYVIRIVDLINKYRNVFNNYQLAINWHEYYMCIICGFFMSYSVLNCVKYGRYRHVSRAVPHLKRKLSRRIVQL